ncbi:MAG: hypothetical protein ACYC2Y_03545 [Armatimonadota bacterium]
MQIAEGESAFVVISRLSQERLSEWEEHRRELDLSAPPSKEESVPLPDAPESRADTCEEALAIERKYAPDLLNVRIRTELIQQRLGSASQQERQSLEERLKEITKQKEDIEAARDAELREHKCSIRQPADETVPSR